MNEEAQRLADVAKDPLSYHWLTYLWVAVISGWGGFVRFLNSMSDSQRDFKRSLLTLFAGLVTSVFVGIITFYACEVAHFDGLTTAICVAITGHLGAEAIRLFKINVITRLKAAWLAAVNPERPND